MYGVFCITIIVSTTYIMIIQNCPILENETVDYIVTLTHLPSSRTIL